MYTVSVIIPAFNEEKFILQVLTPILKSKHVNEVICVNDGSTDKTYEIIRKIKGLKIINLIKNHGKGYAVAKGIAKASGDIIVFIDADIEGLTEKSLNKLISPLLKKTHEVAIGYCSNGNLDKLFRPLSGERAYYKKDLLPYLKEIATKGYGLELFLNYLFRDKKVKLFPIKGVKHHLKHQKQSYEIATKMFLIEVIDLLSDMLKQNNPLSYFIRSYFYSFYIQKPKAFCFYINKLTKSIKKILNAKLT